MNVFPEPSRLTNARPLAIVDAFCDGPFTGNPAGVCLLERSTPEEWMASVAAEVGASETAFLLARGERWLLRWFTPTVEVELCGHATLAAAHVLLGPEGSTTFATRSGRLEARRLRDGRIALDFPRVQVAGVPPDPLVSAAIGAEPRWVGRTAEDLVCVLESAEAVAEASPDLAALASLAPRGVGLTALGGPGADITSRFFAPRAGIPEDPVTGSLHCALGPLWCDWLGRDRLLAHQASPRGGTLEVRPVAGDRVELIGRAAVVIEGRVAGPPGSARA